MDRIQKVPMYNVCVVDVVFCIEGTLYNNGRIAIDRDSFEFAGYMAEDFILGYYRDGVFEVRYFFYKHEDAYSEEAILCLAPMDMEFEMQDIDDLIGEEFYLEECGFYLKFNKIEKKDKALISEVVQRNKNLIEMQI